MDLLCGMSIVANPRSIILMGNKHGGIGPMQGQGKFYFCRMSTLEGTNQ